MIRSAIRLGALGVLVHVHPLEEGEIYDPAKDPAQHFHDPRLMAKQLVGPSPSEIHAIAGFPRAGTYKLWVQLRRKDREIIVPSVLKVAAATRIAKGPPPAIPEGATQVLVGSGGYSPARIEVVSGKPVQLAFLRPDAGNCGGTVVFPDLKLEYDLPVGEVVLVELPPGPPRELSFTCGMGMLKGVLLVK